MICTIQHKSETFEFDSTRGVEISIPILFSEKYLSAFGVGAPIKKPYAVEGFTGSVHQGGSCNCDVIEIIPHCHTTHTECVGHVLDKPIIVNDILKEHFFMAQLATVDCTGDFKISADMLKKNNVKPADALIIRTKPNDEFKKIKQYADSAPYLTRDAIEWMNENGVQHLLVDFPSMDPIWDGGKLAAHRAFWNLSEEQKELDEKTWSHKTITELIYVPNHVQDGPYALYLHTSHMNLDAVPSTPTLYPLRTR